MAPRPGALWETKVEPDNTRTDDGGAGWSWPPYAPWESHSQPRYVVEEWAPPSTVRHPWVRVGRWTLLYRRAA
ncbi:hypothetical protein [Geodermatophilus sp. URMC 64]